MSDQDKRTRFERLMMPHVDAAYNLAWWLVRNRADAEDAVQEAFLRAYKFFGSFRGDDGRAWLLAIVRNACYALRGQAPGAGVNEEFDEQVHLPGMVAEGSNGPFCRNPEDIAIQHADRELVNRAIEELPVVFREVLVMREIEELSYKEIARIVDVPLGTVMSRLARGRRLLHEAIVARMKKESPK
ncbi:MAG: sigma-70 family RNA polymerase sigma factor [Betaproteobacteria bacterium]|nr:sigma-70 family RNA polymerase sigma factor [Betaproteobacteria bacterium]